MQELWLGAESRPVVFLLSGARINLIGWVNSEPADGGKVVPAFQVWVLRDREIKQPI